jgi:hypothetical protein
MLAGDKTRRPSDLREESEVIERHAGAPSLPLPAPDAWLTAPAQESAPLASPRASTATFDGLGLIPTQPVPDAAPERRKPPRLVQRVVRRVSISLALLSVVALAVVALVTTPRRAAPPRAIGSDAVTSAPPVEVSPSPSSTPPPPAPEPPPSVTAAPSVVSGPRPRRSPSKADAGVVAPAPSAPPSARAMPGGIVETPPF